MDDFWTYVKEGGKLALTGAFAFLPELLGIAFDMAPEHTFAAQYGGKLLAITNTIWQGAGIKKKYMQSILPRPLEKQLDKIPDKITGEKGIYSGLSHVKNQSIFNRKKLTAEMRMELKRKDWQIASKENPEEKKRL